MRSSSDRKPVRIEHGSGTSGRSAGAALRIITLGAVCVLLLPRPVLAYIGPGAGFAALGSFLVMFTAMLSAVVTLFTWPVRYIFRVIRGRRAHARSRIRRFVVLGLDGMEPTLVDKFLALGKLPNLARLRDRGCYKRLGTTMPPLSPVAWSSFLTCSNPGKHNIYDFLTRDRRTYLPTLSSVSIRPSRRTLRLGKYEIPIGKPDIRLLRKARPFWFFLGKHGIFSDVIRVPITFPPEKFRGVLLSAMCVPDLRGSQGTFSFYTTRPEGEGEHIGGEQFRVRKEQDTIRSHLVGPENGMHRDKPIMTCPFTVTLNGKPGEAALKLNGDTYHLTRGKYSEWINVHFKTGLGCKVRGICQFLLLSTAPEFEMYVTPINIDPEKPAMPISHPMVYSTYLSKSQGKYATLGLAEDTWALNAEILSDDGFLHQCIQADAERERMFFDALDKVKRGLCCCVFDGTDRIQHMFWRYIDEKHPAHSGQVPEHEQHRNAIEELYLRMDELVGKTMARCDDENTVLMVISDHGFKTFRRGIDLNCWLEQNGYLKLKEGADRTKKYLVSIDFSQTRAFAIGLAGFYLNIKGREEQGIVEPGEEADNLRAELTEKLTGLADPETGQVAINHVYQASKVYRGPYKGDAPDLIVGYNEGYRVSWEAAVGQLTDQLFHDNTKAWSGDHCIDPPLVPGVLLCNRRIETEHPRLIDVGPTVLEMFGVEVPKHMDGRPLAVADANRLAKHV